VLDVVTIEVIVPGTEAGVAADPVVAGQSVIPQRRPSRQHPPLNCAGQEKKPVGQLPSEPMMMPPGAFVSLAPSESVVEDGEGAAVVESVPVVATTTGMMVVVGMGVSVTMTVLETTVVLMGTGRVVVV